MLTPRESASRCRPAVVAALCREYECVLPFVFWLSLCGFARSSGLGGMVGTSGHSLASRITLSLLSRTSGSLRYNPSLYRDRCDTPSHARQDRLVPAEPQPWDASASFSVARSHSLPSAREEIRRSALVRGVPLSCSASQAVTLGKAASASGLSAPRMTPQSVWPQTITSGTRSTPTAYSIVAETPPIASG